jgi:peptidoglycan/LPS O-acetylase OafA/YrhL
MALSTLSVRRASETKKHHRLDIQGLRAVAVGTVLLYHAGMPWLPGGFIGVDVFFVISGFLITGGIVRELRNEGTLSLKGFYARRAARILPAATVALAGVLILTFALLPMTRWLAIGKDAAASTLYFVNWLFASSAVDYMARDQAASPFQHFWSLSVEEQFYIMWPLLLMLAAGVAYRLGKSRQRAFLLALAIVTIPSFCWSIYMTEINPGGAYFATTTRMWELALGAGLAIIQTKHVQIPGWVAGVLGWLGLGAIAFSAFTFTSSLPFPSYTALLPTAGAVAVIWAGPIAGNAGPAALLDLRVMGFVGAISYSLYLWHWPLLVLAGEKFGPLTSEAGLLIVALSFIPAWLSLKYVETPVLNWAKELNGNGPALRMGGLVTIASLTAAVMLAVSVPPVAPPPTIDMAAVRQMQQEAGTVEPIGAEVLFADPATNTAVDSFKSITPAVLSIKDDVPIVNKNGCMQGDDSVEPHLCSFGDTKSARAIVLIGDSHAAMLIPGLSTMAAEHGFRLDTYTKGACPFSTTTVAFNGKTYDSCRQWADNVTAAVLSHRPEAVITVMSRYRAVASGATLGINESAAIIGSGLADAWKPFLAQGVPVFAIRDAPRPDTQVADCIAQNEKKLTACSWPKSSILFRNPPESVAVQEAAGSTLVDLTPAFCPQDICPSVVGGVAIYRDGNHLTATYAQTLHKHLGAALASVLR